MEYLYRHMDWSNIEVLGRNRLPVRPFYCGYPDRESAKRGIREESPNFRLLNGQWKFSYYESPFYVPDGCVQESYDDRAFDTMPVPGHWQLGGYDSPHYNDAVALFPILDDPGIQADNPTGVYRHGFREDKQEDREYILRFDGVESAYHVWLNGIFIGYSQGSRNTAEFDVTEALRDGDNVLAVIVYKFCDGSYLENQDMWWFAGIIRDVSLIQRPKQHMLDCRITSGLVLEQEGPCTVRAGEKKGNFRVEAVLENHTEEETALTIETELFDGGQVVFTDTREICGKKGETEYFTEAVLDGIRPWSAEQPNLYRLVITLKRDGKVLESYGEWTGFRNICLRDGQFLVNGKAIKLKGVNRHDWNENTGRCITKEDMLADLYLMKQNNISAVRTSHYPPHPDFLDMCDRLGFYVMEEADLECNQMAYTKNMNRISDDTLWEESYVDRAERMVRRDKNHPCILFWSLGNESGFGSSFVASGRFIKEYDPTRLVHYEEDRDASIADVYSTMYTRHKALEDLGRDTTKKKPHVVCEYAHAMGNGPGGLKEYWEIFERYPRLQGGFIWEWIDHGIKKYDRDGRGYYTYGGDYGDYPNSGAFCCDGLIQADRRPTPSILQVKKVMEPVKFTGFDRAAGEITVHNKYDFTDLSHLECTFKVHTLQGILLEGKADISGIAPQGSRRIMLYDPTKAGNWTEEQDIWLTITVCFKEKQEWSKEAHYEAAFHQECINEAHYEAAFHQECIKEAHYEAAFHQECIKEAKQAALSDSGDTLKCGNSGMEGESSAKGHPMGEEAGLRVTEKCGIIYIEGRDFTAEFDRVHGYLSGYTLNGERLIRKGLGLNFWRAPVDNDKNVAEIWEKAMLKAMTNLVEKVSVEEREQEVILSVSQIYAPITVDWKVIVKAEYRVTSDGLITMRYDGVPTGVQLPESFPRIGMRFVLDKACEQAVWYGRGPLETYPDCKEGNPVGCWEKQVEDFYFPYVVPQETGNHEDTRWAAFVTEAGNGICIASEDVFSFGALHYTQEDLTQAAHTNELHRTEHIQLSVDYAQHGLGSASWGAECLEKDRLYPEPFTFTWKIFGTGRETLTEQAEQYRRG